MWKGRITEGHKLRAAVWKACKGECPERMLRYADIWWADQKGQTPRTMIARVTELLEDAA